MAKQKDKKQKMVREGAAVKGGTEGGKGKRVPTQPPGMPSGKHNPKMGDLCRCGRCNTKDLVAA